MQNAGGQVGRIKVGPGKTENIRAADRACSESGSHRVTNHAAQTRIRATIRFDGRWMVVGFHFKADGLFLVEFDDTGVVFEHADAPVVVAQLFADFDGGLKDCFLQHVVEADFPHCFIARLFAVVNASGQRLVRTVFAPCLGDGFQLHISGITIQRPEVIANGLHFHHAQIQLAFAAQSLESRVVHVADGNGLQLKIIITAHGQIGQLEWSFHHILNRIVGKNSRHQTGAVGIAEVTGESIFSAGGDRRDIDLLPGQGLSRVFGDAVCDAWMQQHVDVAGPVLRGLVRQSSNSHLLHNAVAQQAGGRLSDLVFTDVALNQKRSGRLHAVQALNAEMSGIFQDTLSFMIAFCRCRQNLNFPQHLSVIPLAALSGAALSGDGMNARSIPDRASTVHVPAPDSGSPDFDSGLCCTGSGTLPELRRPTAVACCLGLLGRPVQIHGDRSVVADFQATFAVDHGLADVRPQRTVDQQIVNSPAPIQFPGSSPVGPPRVRPLNLAEMLARRIVPAGFQQTAEPGPLMGQESGRFFVGFGVENILFRVGNVEITAKQVRAVVTPGRCPATKSLQPAVFDLLPVVAGRS